MPRRIAPASGPLTELFLDMLAAERGAAANTLAAYRRDLDDYAAHLATTKRDVATAASDDIRACLLYTSPSPRDRTRSRMPSSA